MDMPPELAFSKQVTGGLIPFGNLHSIIRIESPQTMPGICDLNYAFTVSKKGWIELKTLSNVPKLSKSADVWTPQQRIFAKRRHEAGETVFFFLKAGRKDYFIFRSYDILGVENFTPYNMHDQCLKHWNGKIDFQELYDLL